MIVAHGFAYQLDSLGPDAILIQIQGPQLAPILSVHHQAWRYVEALVSTQIQVMQCDGSEGWRPCKKGRQGCEGGLRVFRLEVGSGRDQGKLSEFGAGE